MFLKAATMIDQVNLTQVTLLEDNFKNFRGKIIDVGL